jgi:hypothetical protein
MATAPKKSTTNAKGLAKTAKVDDVEEARGKATTVASAAMALVVENDEQYEEASRWLTSIAEADKFVEAKRTSITAPLNEALRNTNLLFKPMAKALTDAKNHVRAIMGTHADRKDAERRRLQAEADERARKDREKLEKQAEKAVASGKIEKAEHLQHRAAAVAAPIVSMPTPKAAGIAMVPTWKFEVTNPEKISPAYLTPDLQKIGDTVRALKSIDEARSVIGEGVRVWVENLPRTTGR